MLDAAAPSSSEETRAASCERWSGVRPRTLRGLLSRSDRGRTREQTDAASSIASNVIPQPSERGERGGAATYVTLDLESSTSIPWAEQASAYALRGLLLERIELS